MVRQGVTCALLYPPITDPTSGYHSLSYLASFARQHGYPDIEIIDTNIEAIDFMAQPAQVEELLQHAAQLRAELGTLHELDGAEQIAYLHAWICQLLSPHDLAEAFAVLRSAEVFYEYPRYFKAAQTVLFWMKCLSLLGFPGQFAHGFMLTPHGNINLNASCDLTRADLLTQVSGPFLPYFERVLMPALKKKAYDLIGINITYVRQLPFALWLLQRIKRELPDAFLLVGGTEVSDIWKYSLPPDRFEEIFQAADGCVVGEGESAFLHVLDCLAENRVPEGSTNLIMNPTYSTASNLLPLRVRYETLTEIPTPDFQQLPHTKYLSPEPFVYYSPSRGCYWNKCTFCDYGLNVESGPTAPWRSDSVDKIVADLRAIAKQSRFIYFSVDVLAPSTLLKVAERLVAESIEIRWSAEIRLETYWSRERCALLRRSGCVAISVGFESGSQRILDLIDKGTRPERVAETIQNFTAAGIGVQMMGFTGFPSETAAEALESVAFLEEERDHWTFGGLGEFVLTPGAIVAREPARFGITAVKPYRGEDIARHLSYHDPVQASLREADPQWPETLRMAKSKMECAPFARPFLGGIDTPHTLMYHDRYGIRIREVVGASAQRTIDEMDDATPLSLNGWIHTETHGFDPAALLTGVEHLHRAATQEGRSLTHEAIAAALHSVTQAKGQPGAVHFVRRDGSVIKLTLLLRQLLEAISACTTLGAALQRLGATGTRRTVYRSLLRFACEHHLVIPSQVGGMLRWAAPSGSSSLARS